MEGLNKVILIGNVGQDPEIIIAGNGNKIAKLSLATSDGMKDRETGQPKTEWHRIVAFSKTAEAIENYVKKGSTICIEGSISYGKYDNSDGVTVYTTDIICGKLTFLDKKENSQQCGQQQNQNYQQQPQQFNVNQGANQQDLPF